MYTRFCCQARDSEEVTVEFVNASISVMSKALVIPEVVEAIEFMERNHRMNSPFDSVIRGCAQKPRAGAHRLGLQLDPR